VNIDEIWEIDRIWTREESIKFLEVVG